MARYRRYRRFRSSRPRRFRSFRGRGYRRGGGNMSGLLYTGAGVAAGYLAPEIIPGQTGIVTLLAVLPVRLPRQIRRLAGGYVIGRMAKSYMTSGNTDVNTNLWA